MIDRNRVPGEKEQPFAVAIKTAMRGLRAVRAKLNEFLSDFPQVAHWMQTQFRGRMADLSDIQSLMKHLNDALASLAMHLEV